MMFVLLQTLLFFTFYLNNSVSSGTLRPRALRFGKCTTELGLNEIKNFEARDSTLNAVLQPLSDGPKFLQNMCDALEKECQAKQNDVSTCLRARALVAEGILGEALVSKWNGLNNNGKGTKRRGSRIKTGGGNLAGQQQLRGRQ